MCFIITKIKIKICHIISINQRLPECVLERLVDQMGDVLKVIDDRISLS